MSMRKSEARKLSKEMFDSWLERNSDPGALPCVPMICISTLTGDKPGITLNLAPKMDLNTVMIFLKAAANQVESKIKELNAN